MTRQASNSMAALPTAPLPQPASSPDLAARRRAQPQASQESSPCNTYMCYVCIHVQPELSYLCCAVLYTANCKRGKSTASMPMPGCHLWARGLSGWMATAQCQSHAQLSFAQSLWVCYRGQRLQAGRPRPLPPPQPQPSAALGPARTRPCWTRSLPSTSLAAAPSPVRPLHLPAPAQRTAQSQMTAELES